jgi:hypothetical protein
MGKDLSETLTYETLIRKINTCLGFVKGKLKRWSNNQEFDYIVSQINRGQYKFTLPSTYYDKNSNKSCLSVRIGSGEQLKYKDKREFIGLMERVDHTTVATTLTAGGTSLVLTSSDDLEDDGIINIYISNILYSITYSANNRTTNTLTITAIAVDITSGLDVWQNESEETPLYFSIWDGYLYIWGLIPETEAGRNIFMDFYTGINQVSSDTDIITEARYDMVQYWLKWEIRNITENNGRRDMTDGDWMMFNQILADAVRRESSGQKYKRKIKTNGIFYGNEENLDFDRS